MIDFETGILRVLKGDITVGAAFVAADFLIVTCAHVVQAAGCEIGEEITLGMPDGSKCRAVIVPEFWRDAQAEDVAILRTYKILEGVRQFKLGSSVGTGGHPFSTFGFPRYAHELSGRGEIIGPAAMQHGVKLLQLRSPEVTKGFSGAPVFDEVTKRVVGIVTSITPPDDFKRLGVTAFAVLSETIRDICSELQISDVCPYRSLNIFTEEDESFFFGRDQIVEKMLECLKDEPRFLAVLGPSGSGKSSVVRAGLIPALKQNGIPGSDKWGVIIVRSTESPIQQLASAGFINPRGGIKSSVSFWLRDNPEKQRLVLIFDQFEEVLVSNPENNPQEFIRELANLLSGSSRITLVIVLRDAFYSRFLQMAPSLLDWFEQGLINIPSTLEQSELRSMVVEPAKKVGLTLEEGLEDIIIQDALSSSHMADHMARSTILPLLEFALTQIWQKRSDGQLTYKAYRQIGGVTGGLTQWASQIYSELEALNQDKLCRRVLSDLVRLGDPETGIPDIRRRSPISTLVTNRAELEEVQNIITRLANARLVIIERDQEEEVVDLIHDSLLTEWHLLRNWINESRNFLIWKQKLMERYNDWKNHLGELLYGRDIKVAKEHLAVYRDRISKELVSYIEESERVIVSNTRRMDELHQSRQLKTAKEIAETIGLGLDLEKTLEATIQILHTVFEKTRLCLLLYQSDIKALKFAPATLKYYKIESPKYRKQDTFPLNGRSIACRVARRALQTKRVECENIADVATDADYLSLSSKIRSELCVSLMNTKNELLGVFALERDRLNGFDSADEDLVKTVGQQLSIAIERAQQSEELAFRSTVAAQTAWAADIAHEINNEVGQIRGWVYLLKEQLEENSPLKEYAKKIEESASILASVGPWSDQPVQILKLDPFLDRHINNLVLQRNLTVEFHLGASDIYIQVRPMEFQHVLRQLVRNAARAMINSRIKKLMISTRHLDESTVEILFQDSGPGISKEVQLSIFQRPVTTKGRGGYGLLLVRQMIEGMDGHISLVPHKKGRGAVFSIQFPIASLMDGTVE